jgi:hypothetical protein
MIATNKFPKEGQVKFDASDLVRSGLEKYIKKHRGETYYTAVQYYVPPVVV